MTLIVTTAPAALPLDWEADVKPSLRIDANDLQAYVESVAIPAAAQWCEDYCNRSLINRGMQINLDRLPGTLPFGTEGYVGGYAENFNAVDWVRSPYGLALELPLAPAKSGSVVFKYTDAAGVLQTWSSALYVVDLPVGPSAMPARIWPAFGQSWPAYRAQRNAIQITWTAGYGVDSNTIPAMLKAAMLLHVEWQVDGRKDLATLEAAKKCAATFRVPKLLRANQEAS